MAPPVYAKMYMLTDDWKYIEFMNREYKATYDYLFDKEEKITSVYCDEYSEDYEYGYDAPPAIDMELLKAISQQCRELGWLDE